MKSGSILVVSWHFYPSREVGAKRPSETALYLRSCGYEVTVLRAWDPSFSALMPARDLRELRVLSVTIPKKRITALWIKLKGILGRSRRSDKPVGAAGDAGSVARTARGVTVLGWLRRQLLAYDTLFQGNKRWLLKSVLALAFRFRRGSFDLVVASGPPMVSYICGWMAARILGAKLVLDYRDPWYLHGDEELSTVMLGHPLARFENDLGRKCAEGCAAIVAASPGTKRHILERFGVASEDVHVIRNGFDEHALVEESPPRGRLEILYAGSLYWNRNPFPFLEAMHRVLAAGDVSRNLVRFRLVGNCETWKDVPLAPWLAERGMQDVVEILPFMSPAELSAHLAESNVLVNFAQGQPRQIPAKSYDYIAAKRDVLVIAEDDSDVADLFREAGLGIVVEPEDSAGFEEAIRALYAKHVVAGTEAQAEPVDVERYSRYAQVSRFAALVDEVLQDRRSAASEGQDSQGV